MARPAHRWDPGANVDLYTLSADGPLVVENGDSRWPMMVKEWIQPILYAGDVGYMEELLFEDGADPTTGARVRGYQYMPANMAFFGADPANGEPQPEDAADPWGGETYRYINAGHRLALRGWIGSFLDDALNVDLQVRWGDGESRDMIASRGAWTGAVVAAFDTSTQQADHLAYALHGKRLGDVSWDHWGGHVDDPVGAFVPNSAVLGPWDGVDAGRVRILVTGGAPLWEIKVQHWDPGIPGWVDIHTATADLQSHTVPGREEWLLLAAYLFAGATRVYPGAIPDPAPYQDTYFRHVSTSQFHPWVIDVSDMTEREYLYRLEAMGLPAAPYWTGRIEALQPVLDIPHYPEGYDYAPEKLRDYTDGAWGVLFGADTVMAMVGVEDRRLTTLTTGAGKHLPICLCDADAYGNSVPFSYVGRYRFKNLGSWGDERCLVSFGRAGYRVVPPAPGLSGLGLTWRPNNDGELVLKYWDGGGAWLELTAPLPMDEYDERTVDLAFSWTGAFGDTIGRDNYELRILVDGVTVATVVEAALRVDGTITATIGTGNPGNRSSFLGHWFGGALFFDPANDTDLRHALDDEGEGGFANPGFETAPESGRPGEAEDWEWQSWQDHAGWADFGAYRADLAPYRYGREGFEGGWLAPYTWEFADEAARLAFVPTADDVGGIAWQRDTNENYVLTGSGPAVWEESEAGENQGWFTDPGAAAVFNDGVPSYETTLELFAIWDGAPWLDEPTLLAPCEETPPTGFDGWYDAVYGGSDEPLCVEKFCEAWGNEPLSTAGVQRWLADTAPNGVMRGDPIEFPLTIPPNENRIIILTDVADPAMFGLPSLGYDTIGNLVTDLNAQIAAHLPGIGLEFGSWSSGDEAGLTFGWDGSAVAVWWGFATLGSAEFYDARPLLGLASFSPTQTYTGVAIPCSTYPVLPAGVDSSDSFLLDSWSTNSFLVITDPVVGTVPIENDMAEAVFDTGVPDPTLLERFTLDGWIAVGATWIDDLGAVALDHAMFDGATHDREDFLDTEWPDEIYPT